MKRNIRPIHIYKDVQSILDRVLAERRPAIYRVGTRQEAHSWISRANRMRIAMRINDELTNKLIEGEGSCIYDELLFIKMKNEHEGSVGIRFREPEGVLTFVGDTSAASPLQYDEGAFNLEDDE